MYLTGHRVRSLSGQVGINALLHRHAGRTVPGMSWDEPDVEAVAERAPGTVVAEHLDVAPGRNHVMSYLDVVAEDSLPPERIERVLDMAERELERRGVPFLFTAEGVGIRFHLEAGLEGYEQEEFKALEDQCLRLLGGHAMDEWQAREPLTIDVTIGEREVRFALDSASAQRIRDKHPGALPPTSITIEHATRDDFERIYGDVIPHMILALTGLRLEDVIELGGVRLKDVTTGQILREWPKRSSP